MRAWKTVDRRTILDHDKFLRVEAHTVELPDGQLIHDWSWVVTPDFVNVVLVDADGAFVCFRQTKYAVPGTSLAVVGGYLEPGEDALAAAQREVLEETGYAASAWHSLGHFAVDGNRGAGTAHLFLATGGRKVAEIDADDLEEQEVVLLSRAEVRAALLGGEFKALPWVGNVGLALVKLEEIEAGVTP
ncbi:MAG: NUDIX hydrolase [Caldilineaceae bacterium]|nr:NUDIX hydrolase [Caldilineaceae bacterium]MBP8108018.1 NUDIX hydrolase [Caldilineaceae bacterium]MBP9071005.1 NUDIX hydrolase [Caldilineaceae bacterium]